MSANDQKSKILIEGVRTPDGVDPNLFAIEAISVLLLPSTISSKAKHLMVSDRTASDLAQMIKIRLTRELCKPGVEPNMGHLPPSDDPVWLDIRSCIHYCENIFLRNDGGSYSISITEQKLQSRRGNYYARLPCPRCPMDQLPKKLDTYFDVFALNEGPKKITEKYYKSHFCERLHRAWCERNNVGYGNRVMFLGEAIFREPLKRSILKEVY